MKKGKKNTYQDSIQKIEQTIQRIQSGEMDLEEMRNEVKAALLLIKDSREKLRLIEQEMNELLDEEE